MIFGIGTDIVAIPRVERSLARQGRRLAERLLAPVELQGFDQALQPSIWLAKRFAVKEAFSKAAKTGMRLPLSWKSVWLTHGSLGEPELCWNDDLEQWLRARRIQQAHVSLSDEDQYVIAFVTLEGADANAADSGSKKRAFVVADELDALCPSALFHLAFFNLL